MATVDYSQTTEDHQSFLVLIRQIGSKMLRKHFNQCWDRISQLECIAIPGQGRDMWVRYKGHYSKENNEFGDFQAHRKALGLLSVGRCSTEREFDELYQCYRNEKEIYSSTMINSRLVVFGMNVDGSPLTEEQRNKIRDISPPPLTLKIDDSLTDSTDKLINEKLAMNNTGNAKIVPENNDPLRSNFKKSELKHLDKNSINVIESSKTSVQKTHSNSVSNEGASSEVLFYPDIDNCEDLEEKVREFLTSIFFVLDGKRLDRSFERADKMQFLHAPFEKKDLVGIDMDTKSFKKKCQGRLRKHLADLCLQAGLPGEAMLHYSTALDMLKPVNDSLWIGACYEGLCAASVISTYVRTPSNSLPMRRNASFSLKRGKTAIQEPALGARSAATMRSYTNGLQDLPESANRTCLNPDDIIEKYKDALTYYSKIKNAGIIEMEASVKACRVLIMQRKYLQASDFLQNVIYINLSLSDEDKIQRYGTLSQLYSQINFKRKSAFYKRVSAMQCVAPNNPKQNWHQCYYLLIQALEGYKIILDPKQMRTHGGKLMGWPVIQIRVLQELIFSAKKMGHPQLAIRHTMLLLFTLMDHLGPQEKREITSSLENLSKLCEATMQALSLENGIIVPPVPLTNVPFVKSFKLMPLQPHLEPRQMDKTGDGLNNGVFIFTPIKLGDDSDSSTTKADCDFSWVEGDISEVHLNVSSPMPDELKIAQLGLLTEGVEMETFPSSPSIPAEAGNYLVKIITRPTSTGELIVSGYTTKVFGVKSSCRLRDCPKIPQTYFKVKVVPALPQIQLSTSLAKAASFLPFGEEANVVTSGTATLFCGQSMECQVQIKSCGKHLVDLVSVTLESTKESKDLVGEVFQWNHENIQSQLPLQVSSLLSFTLALNGVGDFLVPRHSTREVTEASEEEEPNTGEAKCVEAILKVEYSGGPGYEEGYCRCCSVALSIDIQPSVVFHKWDVLPSESADHCHLVFDVQNVSGHQLKLQCSSQNIFLEQKQIQRFSIHTERLKPPSENQKNPKQFTISTSTHSTNSQTNVDSFSLHLAKFVDIQWSIPALQLTGKVDINHLEWTSAQKQLVCMSPVSWDVRINEQLLTPLRIGALEFRAGEVIEVGVEVNVKQAISDEEVLSGVLSVSSCQDCDNVKCCSDISHQVATLGCPSLVVPKISTDQCISHSCSFLFHCTGYYRFNIEMKVRGQGRETETWQCSSVIEVCIIDPL